MQSSQMKAKQQMSYGISGHQLPTSLSSLSLCLAPSDFLLLSFPLAVTFVSYPVDPASSAAMLEAGSHLSGYFPSSGPNPQLPPTSQTEKHSLLL